MAILKDLIVHGSSRFLNKIYASEIQTPLIEAEAGIIKKLKADDATIVGLLDVQGQMHTNSWTNSNIATIDGSFYITPTIECASGTLSSLTVNTNTPPKHSFVLTAATGSSFAVVSSLYYYDTSAHTVTWAKYSKVLITGEILVGGEWIPLGTILGQLNADGASSSISIFNGQNNKHETSTILAELTSTNITSAEFRNLKISLYQRSGNTTTNTDAYKYPLGIYLTALGQNGKTFLDIYGGVNALTTSYGGYANPNVRIGNLSGLPAITTAAGNYTPVGWGIYTTNGYFSGTIVSNTGVIGGWKLGASSLHNGTTGLNDNTVGIYLGTDGIRNYSTSTQYVNITGGKIKAQGVDLTGKITASSGFIGGWNIGTDTNKSLYYGNQTPGATTTNLVLSPTSATNSNAIGGSATGLNWFLSAGKVFGVTTAGDLYASSAHISGEIIATDGRIGGIDIVDGNLNVSSISIGNLDGASNYAQKSYVDDAVNDIEIGGRNYLRDSNVTKTNSSGYTNAGSAMSQVLTEGTTITISIQIDADDVVWANSGNRRLGTELAITKTAGGNQYLGAWAGETASGNTVVAFNTSYHGRVSNTFTLLGDIAVDKVPRLYIQGITSGTVSVSKVKVQIGNKATDYTLAPEDVEIDIEDAKKTATNYLSVDETGIMIADLSNGNQTPSEATGRNVFIDNDSVDIRNGQNTLARFTGEDIKFYDGKMEGLEIAIASFGGTNGVCVGNEEETHFVINNSAVKALNNDGATIFSIETTDTLIGNTVKAVSGAIIPEVGGSITLNTDSSSLLLESGDKFYIEQIVLILDVITTNFDQYDSITCQNFQVNQINQDINRLSYTTNYEGTPSDYFTVSKFKSYLSTVSGIFTYRTESSLIYNLSGTFQCGGTQTSYSGQIRIDYDGNNTLTFNSLINSSSFGNESFTLGSSSYYSCGDIMAINKTSYAPTLTFGTRLGTVGPLSTVIGEELYAPGRGQMTIGKFNYGQDTQTSTYSFVVGNGQNDAQRSNAFTIDWDGNVGIQGKIHNIIINGNTETKLPLFHFESRTWTISSIGADGGWYGPTSNDTPSTRYINVTGYTPVAIAGYTVWGGTNSGWCVVPRLCIEQVTDDGYGNPGPAMLQMYIWNQNTRAAATNIKFTVEILYIANNFIN